MSRKIWMLIEYLELNLEFSFNPNYYQFYCKWALKALPKWLQRNIIISKIVAIDTKLDFK